MEMSEYYLPMHGANTHYHRIQAPLPIAPQSFRLSHHYSSEPMSKAESLRSPSSSSMESNLKAHNDLQSFQEQPRRTLPVLKSEPSFQSFQDSALPPIDNPLMSDLSSDEPKCEVASPVFCNFKEEHSEDMARSDVAKLDSSGRDTSPASKMSTGKKSTNLKVSEKRRQQNRTAQRAMRERRKRAAQHQEVHMTAILTENAILREKVAYLSNMLLSHAIAPAGHLPWNPIPHQESLPPMLPSLNTAHLPARSAAPPGSSSPDSPLSFQNHPMFPAVNLVETMKFH